MEKPSDSISDFYGITVRMHGSEHEVGHFHVEYDDHRAVLSIETLEVLSGRLPRRVLSFVLEWVTLHRAELRENWTRLRRGEPLLPLAPLDDEEAGATPWRVIKVRALPGHHLEIEFADGLAGVLDYSHEIWGPVFEPLRDPARWAEVGIDEEGVVCWPNGADLAADAMYERLKAQTPAAP